MEKAINEYLNSVLVSDSQSFENLQCFPLISAIKSSIGYLTLDE